MFPRLLEDIAKALERFEIPYMIVGGQAILFYGDPRLTKDIDITLGLDFETLPRILEVALNANLDSMIKNDVEGFVRQNRVLPMSPKGGGLRVDFIFSFTPYEREAIKRTVNVKVGDSIVRFASIEDVIIHKLFSGRPLDIEDVKRVLRRTPVNDKTYLNNWLGQFSEIVGRDLQAQYKTLCRESGIVP